MVIVCWGNLAKSADETTRIEQSIEDYIEGHDENPNAHMGPDYALGAHRLAVMLDHAPYSVRNLFVYPQSRTYKAIVDPTGNGDLTTIQEAIDYVAGLGGGEIFLKNGTYILTADIVIPSNVQLIGESMDGVILDFDSGNYQVLAEGIVNEGPTGSISLTYADATVTGTGTLFEDEVSPGDYIRIDDAWYKIVSITDQLHMELSETFRGVSRVITMFEYMTPKTNINLENFTIKRSADGFGLKLRGLLNCRANNITSKENADNGMGFYFCANCSFRDIYSETNEGFGIVISDCQSTYFNGPSAIQNNEIGIQLQNAANLNVFIIAGNASHNGWMGIKIIGGWRCGIIACTATGNKLDGIELSGPDYILVEGCSSDNNGENGINLVTSANRCRIVNNLVRANQDTGIYLVGGGAAAHHNVVTGNTVINNVNAQITDNGASNDVAHNIIT